MCLSQITRSLGEGTWDAQFLCIAYLDLLLGTGYFWLGNEAFDKFGEHANM